MFQKAINKGYEPYDYSPEEHHQTSYSGSVPLYDMSRFNYVPNVSKDEEKRFSDQCKRSVFDNMEQQKEDWNIKAQRFYREKRFLRTKYILLITFVLLCISGTLLRFRPGIQFMLYTALIAVVAMTDPAGAVGRFLALPSRILICFDCGCLILLQLTARVDIAILTLASIVISFFLIKALNAAWLSADCWRDSEAVELALRRDPEGLGARAWQSQGRREVHTALVKLGLNADQDALDYCHRVTFEIGYSLGLDKADKLKFAVDQRDQAKEELLKAHKQIKILQNNLDSQQEETQRLLSWQQDQLSARDFYKDQYSKAQKENELLRQANNELLENVETLNNNSNDNVIELPKLKVIKTTKEIVLDALQKGCSYQQAADLAGVSKSTAYRLAEDYRQELAKAEGL